MKRSLRITEEAAFGTYSGTGTSAYVRLDAADAFTVMTTPEYWEIMSGSGFAVPALAGTQTSGLAATLSTPLHYSQAALLLNWALTRNPGAWTTGEAAGDLASTTLDYIWTNADGTERTKRFLGCKVASFALAASRESPVVRLQLGIVGSTPQANSFDGSVDPTLTDPADSVFPADPVLFQHLKAGLTIGGAARSNFQSISFRVQNRLKAYFDEGHFANLIRLGGRRSTLGGAFRLKAGVNDRTSWESGTPFSGANTAVFTQPSPGTHSVTINLNSTNYAATVKEHMPLDEEIYYDFSLLNLLDTTATTDFTVTIA